jgi:sulfate permease, SulP family
MSATAMVREAGARSRLANVVASVVMALVILLFADVAGHIAMPALAGLLMLVGCPDAQAGPGAHGLAHRATQAAVLATTFVLTPCDPASVRRPRVGVALSHPPRRHDSRTR